MNVNLISDTVTKPTQGMIEAMLMLMLVMMFLKKTPL